MPVARRPFDDRRTGRLSYPPGSCGNSSPHQALLAAAETVGKSASAADRKAYRIYRDRLQNATT